MRYDDDANDESRSEDDDCILLRGCLALAGGLALAFGFAGARGRALLRRRLGGDGDGPVVVVSGESTGATGAVIAGFTADFARNMLAEVREQSNAAAARAILEKVLHRLEKRHGFLKPASLRDAFLGHLDESLDAADIATSVEHDTLGWKSIATGAHDFLIRAFKTFWRAMMDNPTHVWLVDAHSESDCGAAHGDFAAHPFILHSETL